MSEQDSTRNKLISTGLRALMAKGYDGFGIGPVLAEAGVPKGSFYYYFASKEEFVVAIVEAYSAHYAEMRSRLFTDTTRSPLERLDTYLQVLEREFALSCPSGGCLYGVLTQSVSERGKRLTVALAQAFNSWRSSLEEMIALAQAEIALPHSVNPRAAATLLIDLYEGALIRAKALNSAEPIAEFRALVPKLIALV